MPSNEDLEDVMSVFRRVLALAEDAELRYDIDKLAKACLRVHHKPIPDFFAPNNIELHGAIEFVDCCEEPVLVHYLGGRGRSGTIAVAYLMASQGISYEEALARIRNIDPGFFETGSKHKILKLYDRSLRIVPRRLISKTVKIGKKYMFGRGVGHAAKLQLIINILWNRI